MLKEVPIQFLPAVAAKWLKVALNIAMAAWTYGKCQKSCIEGTVHAVMGDTHGETIGEFLVIAGKSQQLIGRLFETDAELFQCVDGRGCFAAGNGAEISGTEVAEFGSRFVGKFTTVADAKYGDREVLGEHGKPSPSV